MYALAFTAMVRVGGTRGEWKKKNKSLLSAQAGIPPGSVGRKAYNGGTMYIAFPWRMNRSSPVQGHDPNDMVCTDIPSRPQVALFLHTYHAEVDTCVTKTSGGAMTCGAKVA